MNDLEDSVIIDGTATVSETDHTPVTEPPETPLVLEEHESTDAFPLSESDADFLAALGGDAKPVRVTYTAAGDAKIHTGSYVGVVTLPSGTKIQVTPKEEVGNLLYLLQFALDVSATTADRQTGLSAADTFIDAFGSLFYAELMEVFRQGIRRTYKRVNSVEDTVRGRLDVQRQLQRPTPIPTDFAVEYDTLTTDTTLNRAIHLATQRLSVLVDDETLSANLSLQADRLNQFVTPSHVSMAELNAAETTRLTDHYEDLLKYVRIVLSHRFFEDIAVGSRASFGLFINMNAVFELVVGRAFREAAHQLGGEWTVEEQGDSGALIDGPHAVDMTPDFLVKEGGAVRLVGDAKWKTGQVEPSDVYQMTSYMLADEAPGVLVYPHGSGTRDPSWIRANGTPLRLQSIDLPTATPGDSYEAYTESLITAAKASLRALTAAPQ